MSCMHTQMPRQGVSQNPRAGRQDTHAVSLGLSSLPSTFHLVVMTFGTWETWGFALSVGPSEQKELRSAGQWLLRGDPQTWRFKMFFISTSKSYEVEPLMQPTGVTPTTSHQPRLGEASDHSWSPVGSPPLTQEGLGVRPEHESAEISLQTSWQSHNASARSWQQAQEVLGKGVSFAKRCWQRAVFELSISYSFVYFTCSLTV